jgi:hypothetical protein
MAATTVHRSPLSATCRRSILLLWLLLARIGEAALDERREYLVVGVSGGLQDGFPEHVRLDFHSGEPDESKAIFLGRALVRGYKAYLDVMQDGWRQYTVSTLSLIDITVLSLRQMKSTVYSFCSCMQFLRR